MNVFSGIRGLGGGPIPPRGILVVAVVIILFSGLGPAFATPSGQDNAYAGEGRQYAEWSRPNARVSLGSSAYDTMSTDRCIDSVLDWRHTSGPHYDSRVVRNCQGGWYVPTYDWSGDAANGLADLNQSDIYWNEPSSAWGSADVDDVRMAFGYEMDDDFVGGEFEIYQSERFAGGGSGALYPSPPRTCTDQWSRVLTRYQSGHYAGCKNYPANSSS